MACGFDGSFCAGRYILEEPTGFEGTDGYSCGIELAGIKIGASVTRRAISVLSGTV